MKMASRSGAKSYAILRHTDKIMAHMQVCPVCSEFVMAHTYPELGITQEEALKTAEDAQLTCVCGDKMKCSDARQADAFAIKKLKEQVKQLTAENAKYKSALEKISNVVIYDNYVAMKLKEIAKKALEEKVI
jgi:ribosomal protein L32